MAWPFNCPPPEVSVSGGDLRLTVWRARDSDASPPTPAHRAVYTYGTWASGDMHALWGRVAPLGSAAVEAELLSHNDSARWDGTCTEGLADAVASIVTTAYHPAGLGPGVAMDFAPCVEAPAPPVPHDNPWFQPATYPTRGWAFRFGLQPSGCSLRFDGLRELPAGATRFAVVELGASTACALPLCAVGGAPFAGFRGEALLRRATVWDLASGREVPDVRASGLSAVWWALSERSARVHVRGTLAVGDPNVWPGATDVAVHNLTCGACAGALDAPMVLQAGGEWVAPFTVGCTLAAPVPASMTLACELRLDTAPWGERTWARGGARQVDLTARPRHSRAPPPAAGVPDATLLYAGAMGAVRFGAAVRGDEAAWDVTASGLALSTSSIRTLGAAPAPDCAASPEDLFLYAPTLRDGVAVFSNNLRTAGAPLQVALCATVSFAPAAPLPPTQAGGAWPAWSSAAAAARFSAGGAVANASEGAFLSLAPVWEDGTALCPTPPCAPAPGYPYLGAGPASALDVPTAAEWVGFLSFRRPAPSVAAAGGARAAMSPPPPPALAPPPAALLRGAPPDTAYVPGEAVGILSASSLLLALATAVLAWVVASAYSRRRAAAVGAPRQRAGVARVAPGRAGATQAFVLLSAIPAANSLCAAARAAACVTCAGSMAASTCACTCGVNHGESVVLSMLILPSLAIMLLYV